VILVNKVVFGFCIAECGSYNVDGAQAASAINNLNDAYPCNGGAFFWVAEYDVDGSWSVPVSNARQISTGSCSAGNTVGVYSSALECCLLAFTNPRHIQRPTITKMTKEFQLGDESCMIGIIVDRTGQDRTVWRRWNSTIEAKRS
jgi:hypothetical protein